MLKKRIGMKILGAGSLCLFLLGCKEESFLVQQESSMVIEEVLNSQENLVQKEDGQREAVTKNENAEEYQGQEEEFGTQKELYESEIVVYICGAVKQPGVYYLKENQRLYEGIQKAGGFREDADEEYLNQAMELADGMKIVVPTKEETAGEKQDYLQNNNVVENQNTKSGKIDLNTADEAQLCTLPGIGESRAKSIINYREEHGLFQKTEDVMKVSGIKEAAFEKIKDYITVSR